MRDFNDADRKKKSRRIQLPENPGNLSAEALAQLEDAVKAAVRDGGVSCPSGWRIAKDAGVSRLDVGVRIDKLGIRVTDCQLGCFTVGKTPYTGESTEAFGEAVSREVEDLNAQGKFTCSNVFALARKLGVKPVAVADAGNVKGYKIRECQLGCF